MKNTKKLKKQKVKLIDADFLQALDYSNVMLTAFDLMMRNCNVLKDTVIRQQFNKATEELANLYQIIGYQSCKYESKK